MVSLLATSALLDLNFDLGTLLTLMHSMALETGIFLSQAIWLWRVRHIRREAKKHGKTYDEYVAEHPSEKLPRSGPDAAMDDVEAAHNASQDTLVATEKVIPTGKKDDADPASLGMTLASARTHRDSTRTNETSDSAATPPSPQVACPERALMPSRYDSRDGTQ
jgi:hypothetical protein